MQPAINDILPYTIRFGRLLVTALLTILAAFLMSLLLSKKVKKQIQVEQILTAFLGLMFVFNIVPFVNAAIQIQSHSLDEIPLKESFEIEKDTASPNVYWIHADGMLGMDAFEKYFKDPQSEFYEALSERGFEVNKSARFEAAHATGFAISVLTNPYAYDNYLNQLTETHEAAMAAYKDHGYWNALSEICQNSELMSAFAEKGYAVYLDVGESLVYYPPIKNSASFFSSTRVVAYDLVESSAYKRMIIHSELTPLLNLSFYFSVPATLKERFFPEEKFENQAPYHTQMSDEQLQQALLEGWTDLNGPRYQMEALYEVLHGDYSAPRLTVIHDFTAHFPFYYNENGEISQGLKNMDLPDYYPQHMYCAKVLLNMIDMILEADPDAVIVIQADHGLHGNVEEDFQAAFGEDADALELWNSTMSTIRVPEIYRTGEEHYATENPLNISRYLVNSFVGKNYEYLPPN